MRFAATLIPMAGMLLLAGCPGSVIDMLPPGSGPGVYSGAFEDEDENEVGNFTLTINDVGVVSGNGLLLGGAVDITGSFAGGEVDALITDAVTQLSGPFDGTLVGTQLAGDYRLPQLDGDDPTGLWDAAPAS